MKKILTSMAVALLLMAMPAKAQFSWGVTGGLNLANISTSSDNIVSNNLKSKQGFFVGPTVKFTLPLIGLGIDAAALYDQREGEANGENIKFQSLQIPLNIRYGVGLGSLANVFAFAGPQFGFNIGDSSKKLTANLADTYKEWTLRSSNLSINVGIGATLFSHLQARLNYNIAMGKTGEVKDVYTAASTAVTAAGKAVGDVAGVTETKANSWQVSLTYFF